MEKSILEKIMLNNQQSNRPISDETKGYPEVTIKTVG